MAIKDYEIIKEVGSGGMGAVYLARDPRLDRLVAIKKVKVPANLEKEIHSEIVQRFYREARAMASLNHPNIVTVYDLGEDEETKECFMVMEYLEGKSLDKMIEEEKVISEELTLKIAIQACDALDYLHRKQVVHRDIKPGNMIYCSDEIIKLMDFGLVRRDDNLNLTRAGTLLGSVLFMPLEQIQNPKNVDSKVDMYSFGVTLYNMLSGDYPYNGSNALEVVRKVTLENPIPLSQANPKISSELEAIVMRAIARNKDERYSDMKEFKQDLVTYQQNLQRKEIVITNNENVHKLLQRTIIVEAKDTSPSTTTIEKTTIERRFSELLEEVKEVEKPSSEKKEAKKAEKDEPDTGLYDMMRLELLTPTIQDVIATKKAEYYHQKSENSRIKVPDNVISLINKNFDDRNIESTNTNFDLNLSLLTSNYPHSIRYIESTQRGNFYNNLNNIKSKLLQDLEPLKKIVEQLKLLEDDVSLEIDDIEKDIRQLSNSSGFRTLSFDPDTKRKVDGKKSQLSYRTNDLSLLEKKISFYESLLNSKKLRIELTDLIAKYVNEPDKPTFFNEDYSIFDLPETLADNFKELVHQKINNFMSMSQHIEAITKSQQILKKNDFELSTLSYTPSALVTKFLPKTNSVEAKIVEDMDNYILIELDTGLNEIIFTPCTIMRNERPVPRVKKGDIVIITADAFTESLKNQIRYGSEIFVSKLRLCKKNLFSDELVSYENLPNILDELKEIFESNVNMSFDTLASMFLELDIEDPNTFLEKKASAMVKTNKLKKAILELKKDFEASSEPIISEYAKYINNIFLAINRFPILLKSFEDEIRQKKEARKRIFHNLLSQLSKANAEAIREKIGTYQKAIQNFASGEVPASLVDFLSFYLLAKAKLPTNISKNEVIINLNGEKEFLNALEIDYICKLLNLGYNKEKGFILKVNS